MMHIETLGMDEKIELLASLIGDNFLRLAKSLRELQDAQPGLFRQVAKLAGVGARKAYALARIARQFESVPEDRLYAIGWTKLQVIGRYLNDENTEYLLQLAQQNTAHDLEVLLRGEAPINDARVVQLYLAPGDYKRLRTALIAHGAITNGSGLAKMESALMVIVGKVEGNES